MDFLLTITLIVIVIPILLILFIFGVVMLFSMPLFRMAKRINNPTITICHETIKGEKKSSFKKN